MNSRSLNLYCHYSRGSPLEFCGCLFTSSTGWEIRHLHVVLMQWRKWQRNVQEKHDAWAKLLFCLNLMLFLTFSPSPDLKIPNVFKTCLTDQTLLEQTVFNDIGKRRMRSTLWVEKNLPYLSCWRWQKRGSAIQHGVPLKPTYQTAIFGLIRSVFFLITLVFPGHTSFKYHIRKV